MRRFVPLVTALTLGAGAAAWAGVKNVNGVEVRDWEAIDSNDDRHVSSDEMERFLREIRAGRERRSES